MVEVMFEGEVQIDKKKDFDLKNIYVRSNNKIIVIVVIESGVNRSNDSKI